jgi:muramidase (phage lysozyme)
MNANRKAFLTMIAMSELGRGLISTSNQGYNVIVGSTVKKPILFNSYADHPRKLVNLPKLGIKSTAAGRYQILARYYDAYKKTLKLPDFSPQSQDKIAIQLLKECKALDDIDAGRFDDAVRKCRSRWSSLPGSPYGQHTNKLDDLRMAYVNAGGVVA